MTTEQRSLTSLEEAAESYRTAEVRYIEDTIARQREAMAKPRARKLVRRIKRLAAEALEDVGNLREFTAYAAAIAMNPDKAFTVVAAHDALCGMMNADDQRWKARGHSEFFESTEDLELLLAIGDLLRMLRIAPGLRFYPHRDLIGFEAK